MSVDRSRLPTEGNNPRTADIDTLDPRAHIGLREGREKVPRALEAIASSPGLSPEEQSQVETAQAQWRFLADAARQLDASSANPRAIEFACKAADHIQEMLQKLY